MNKTRIGILFGGKSGEHEVSLRSAAAVVRHLDSEKYELILIGIDPQGVWFLQRECYFKHLTETVEALEIRDRDKPVVVAPGRGLLQGREPLSLDLVFPVLHGTYGEDGTIQGSLEIAGLPYVGAGVLGSALAMDKENTKYVWIQYGLPVVDFIVVRDADRESMDRAEKAFPYPLFVKPGAAGSSVGVSKVSGRKELSAALQEALRHDLKALVEPAIQGREIECAVLGNRDPEAFEPGEIIPTHEFYDYDAKYVDPDGAALDVPAKIPPALRAEIKSLAVQAFLALECSGMARVDFFWENGSGRVLLNEINTIPGFTNISMYPKMCAASGMDYLRLLDRLVELGLERHSLRRGLSYKHNR